MNNTLQIEKKSKSKYKNKKVVYNGIKFASEQEYQFYLYLMTMYSANEITTHPKFVLQPEFNKYGIKHRAIIYVADFQINNFVYDVKGFTTADFMIKKKIFNYKYPNLALLLVTPCPLKWKPYNDNNQWIELDNLKLLQKPARLAKNKARRDVAKDAK
jgi:hypothetical protein